MTADARPHRRVLIVGAGLAGLTAADRLTRAGIDARVLEAGAAVGGRVRGEPVGSGEVVDTGAEFLGHRHYRVRAALATLGLRAAPSGLDRAPIHWRIAGRSRTSWLPPIPPRELWRLARACRSLSRHASTMDPDRPWRSPGATDLDQQSLADWLAGHRVGSRGRDVGEALIGGFATTQISELSVGQVGWWLAAAGGLTAAARSGQEQIIVGGAHQLPRRLADRLGDRVRVNTVVSAVHQHEDGVEVRTEDGVWAADAAVLAIPLPALRAIEIDPVPHRRRRDAVRSLGYGRAIKISAVSAVSPPVRHRSVLGGAPVNIAWRHGTTLAGIATGGTSVEDLTDDLTSAFGLRTDQLSGVAVTDWTREPHIGGSYLTCTPGQLTTQVAALHPAPAGRIRYAGADHSSWPNSMEGAIQSGHEVADQLLATQQTW